MTRKALIVGSSGQDGRLLWKQLEERGYDVAGWTSRGLVGSRFPAGAQTNGINDPDAVAELVRLLCPDEIYFLAAHHHSSEEGDENSGNVFRRSIDTHVLALVNFLEAVRTGSPASRLFYAASSHIFGSPTGTLQDESTPINPESPYGISKAAGIFTCRHYRNAYGVHAAAGILYNHESPLRPDRFLSRRISQGVARIKRGQSDNLVLGNLDAVADWGYAPDYTDAMQRILAAPADDFVIATGKPHTVRDFARIAFDTAGLDYRAYVMSDASVLRRSHGILVGSPAHLMTVTNWQPSLNFEDMVRHLVMHELTVAKAA